ncbi:MAG: cell wall hydrolase [Novosphingobium sp.]
MYDTSVLHLRYCDMLDRPAVQRDMRAPIMWAALALVAAALLVVQLGGSLSGMGWGQAERPVASVASTQARQVTDMTVDDKAQIMAEGTTAQEQNAAIALSSSPVEQAGGFMVNLASTSSQATALRCLSQAVYYEAATEPMEGRRAVAQVVLNRVRHPAYPKSVCGVVYQGSERRTGCQFSFTCDGSLLRTPMAGPWRQAQEVARAALAGYVEKSVGTATHYHADYVLPKWAFQLAKIEQLGRHIFYRFNGNWGRAKFLSGHYSGQEHIPAINLLALRQRAASNDGLIEPVYETGLTVAPHVTDRHATADVGGRLDVTKEWRLTIPDPVSASSRYRDAVAPAPSPTPSQATAEQRQPEMPTS